MNFTIRYENFEKPSELESFIKKKMVKLEKFRSLGNILKIHIVLNKEYLFEVSCSVEVTHNQKNIIANAKNRELLTSIDEAFDKLLLQIIKIKEKRI